MTSTHPTHNSAAELLHPKITRPLSTMGVLWRVWSYTTTLPALKRQEDKIQAGYNLLWNQNTLVLFWLDFSDAIKVT